MQKYKNLTIIGTSHIAIQSIKEVEEAISKIKPEIVAIELDKLRFNALIYKQKRKLNLKDIKKIGMKGFLFNLVGAWIEKKLGKVVGVAPGSEMKKAVEIAYKIKADIALIDQNISKTLKRLSKEITWKEKFRFIGEIITGIFKRPKIKIDLTKVPSQKIINKLTSRLKKLYPSIYKVLIKERNEVMAKNLYNLMNTNKEIIAVMGAGHEEEIIELIKSQKGGAKSKLNLLKPG
ncbi:hypothetical protein CL621_02775 [archaeon]|nr:hypothetical protein [archaeon]|tara:strand:- start:587 stop:1288 length:702 start_codon:yes stop_codon:yes gene_type:complete